MVDCRARKRLWRARRALSRQILLSSQFTHLTDDCDWRNYPAIERNASRARAMTSYLQSDKSGPMPFTGTEIAIDARPASPAMARALEAISRNGEISRNRIAAINADPRVIRLRAMKASLGADYDAAQMVADFVSGRAARDQRINALVRARVGQIDRNVFAVRENLRHAARLRREHSFRREALTAPVVVEAVCLADAMEAA